MPQNTKKCTAPNAFTPGESDMFADAPKSSALLCEMPLSTDELCQNISVFLHDILNSAGGLRGFLELMEGSEDPAKVKKYASNAFLLCDNLIGEIEHYRVSLKVKSGDLNPVMEEVKAHEILELATLKLKMHCVSKGRTIEIDSDFDSDISIRTDKVLLSYILVNMIKNAIEATEEGGTVLTGVENHGDRVRFWVHNEGVIPDDVQERLFDMYFSTKGANRGIGLFSVRLIGENALGGQVRFESSKEKGTCFYIDLPSIS
jgi:signal transduction histidine kinase